MSATTPNMGLTQWTSVNDHFNHAQLVANFTLIDQHDHTGSPTKGLQIPTGGVVNLAITAAKLAADSVITSKILNANVTTAKLADQAVTAPKVGILPRARAYHNGTQTITNNTVTALTFNSERFDTDSIHDTVTNADRMTCKTAGTYLLGVCINWAVNSTGTRYVALRVNGTTIIEAATTPGVAVNDVQQSISTIYPLAVNDYVQVIVKQTSGSGLDITAAANYSPEVYAAFLSN